MSESRLSRRDFVKVGAAGAAGAAGVALQASAGAWWTTSSSSTEPGERARAEDSG